MERKYSEFRKEVELELKKYCEANVEFDAGNFEGILKSLDHLNKTIGFDTNEDVGVILDRIMGR